MANGQVNQIFNVLQTIVQDNNVTSEKTWLQEHLSDARLRPIVARTSVVGLHILSGLESGQRKGIDLAEDLNVTRGGIYRAAQSLEQLGLITSQHAADNKKNRYYALTGLSKRKMSASRMVSLWQWKNQTSTLKPTSIRTWLENTSYRALLTPTCTWKAPWLRQANSAKYC